MPAPVIIAGIAKLAVAQGVKAAITRALTPKANRQPLTVEAQAAVLDVVSDLTKDPVFINATNSEKPVASRTTIGGTQSALGGIVFLTALLLKHYGVIVPESFLMELFGAAIGIWGGIYTLWGRWAPNLKPLFETAWGKVMGALGLGSIFAALVLVIIMVVG